VIWRRTHTEPVAPSLVERSQAARDRAAGMRQDRAQQEAETFARVAELQTLSSRSQADLEATVTRATSEADRLDRAAIAFAEAAEVDQRLPQLQGTVNQLAAEITAARSEVETLTARRDRLAAEVATAADDEKAADPSVVVAARARGAAALELVAEADDAVAQAERHLVDVHQQHDVAVAVVEQASDERDDLVQVASDILDGTEDVKLQRQAEEDARRAAEAEVHRDRQIASVMLDATAMAALAEAVGRRSFENETGWRGLTGR
jgi:hypothetical protein